MITYLYIYIALFRDVSEANFILSISLGNIHKYPKQFEGEHEATRLAGASPSPLVYSASWVHHVP